MRRMTCVLLLPFLVSPRPAPASELTGLARLLEAETVRFPARTGLYVKHLGTGEEAGIRADEAFSSASVIKLPILVRAYQLAEQGRLSLDKRVEIRREHFRDGTGVLQYHDAGLAPTFRDLLTQMIITSDNTATDLVELEIGGVEALNDWLTRSGYRATRKVGRGYEYRRALLALLDPRLGNITPEETTALMYASQDSPLFDRYGDLFNGERAAWVELVQKPENRHRLAGERNRRTVEDPAYWLGSMTPQETARMLEAIERETIASPASCREMKTILRRQQLGTRRIPHYLSVPVGHKTGDSAVIANDAGMIYARSGTIVVAFFTNGVVGSYAELEDGIGRVSRLIVEYFDGAR